MNTNRRRFLAGSSALAASAALGRPSFRAAAQDATTINWWHITTNEDQAALAQASADEFAAANGVDIEITILENEAFKARLTTVMQGGEPPDVFQSWGGGVLAQYAEAGLVRDLTDDLAVDGWGESFGQAGLNLYAAGGRNYGVPRDLGMIGVWYSKSKFAEAGIEAPPETWSDFLAVTQQIKDAGITPIALGGGDRWPIHFYFSYLALRHGGGAAYQAAYNGEGSFADEPFVNAAADLLALAELEPFQDGFLAATWPDSGLLYASGDAAMMLMGHWFPSGALDANLDDPTEMRADLGWFPFPAVEGGAGAPNDVLGGGNGFVLGVNAPDIAVDFVRHLTSLETQQTWAAEGFGVPPTVIGAESVVTDENLLPVMEYLQNAGYFQLYYDQDLPPATGQVVLDESQALVAGQQTPEGMAQAIQAAYEVDLAS